MSFLRLGLFWGIAGYFMVRLLLVRTPNIPDISKYDGYPLLSSIFEQGHSILSLFSVMGYDNVPYGA